MFSVTSVSVFCRYLLFTGELPVTGGGPSDAACVLVLTALWQELVIGGHLAEPQNFADTPLDEDEVTGLHLTGKFKAGKCIIPRPWPVRMLLLESSFDTCRIWILPEVSKFVPSDQRQSLLIALRPETTILAEPEDPISVPCNALWCGSRRDRGDRFPNCRSIIPVSAGEHAVR